MLQRKFSFTGMWKQYESIKKRPVPSEEHRSKKKKKAISVIPRQAQEGLKSQEGS